MIELSLEQQFSILSFKRQVEQMSHEQAQEMLILLYEQMAVKEAMYRHLLNGALQGEIDAAMNAMNGI